MIKIRLLLFSVLFAVYSYGQITIIGHNKLNNDPVGNTLIRVKEGGGFTKTLTTKPSGDFLIKLAFGKKYSIYFQNPKSPLIYLDVVADNVPEEKYSYKMVHELNIPLYDKNDED